MIMKRFYFMLAILPMLVACSTNNEDEPISEIYKNSLFKQAVFCLIWSYIRYLKKLD